MNKESAGTLCELRRRETQQLCINNLTKGPVVVDTVSRTSSEPPATCHMAGDITKIANEKFKQEAVVFGEKNKRYSLALLISCFFMFFGRIAL